MAIPDPYASGMQWKNLHGGREGEDEIRGSAIDFPFFLCQIARRGELQKGEEEEKARHGLILSRVQADKHAAMFPGNPPFCNFFRLGKKRQRVRSSLVFCNKDASGASFSRKSAGRMPQEGARGKEKEDGSGRDQITSN